MAFGDIDTSYEILNEQRKKIFLYRLIIPCLFVALLGAIVFFYNLMTTSFVAILADEITINPDIYFEKRIAVMDFIVLETGKTSNLSRTITEDLNTELIFRIAEHNGIVLERSQIESIIKEFEFQLSNLADPLKAKEIGKALSADLLIVGSLSHVSRNLNVRVIEAEGFGILAGSKVKLPARHFDRKTTIDRQATHKSNFIPAFLLMVVSGGVTLIISVIFPVARFLLPLLFLFITSYSISSIDLALALNNMKLFFIKNTVVEFIGFAYVGIIGVFIIYNVSFIVIVLIFLLLIEDGDLHDLHDLDGIFYLIAFIGAIFFFLFNRYIIMTHLNLYHILPIY